MPQSTQRWWENVCLLDKYVELIGEPNVIQVVTDSALANLLAGNIFSSFKKKKFLICIYI